ncbi:hypothetical protein BDQ17DRAFT_1377780 [Cyathus striatus]|nr:hypothetical protein BDQ17DRAFT_1377780 [Cyathus striatus]
MTTLTALTLYVDLGGLQQSLSLHSVPPLEVLKIVIASYTTVEDSENHGQVQGLPRLIAKSSSKLRHLDLQLYTSINEEEFLSSLTRQAPPLSITHLTLSGSVHLYKAFAPHFRSLESLHLKRVVRRDNLESAAGGTWTMLKEEKIYLRHVTHIEPAKSLLQYFRSYTGLKSAAFIEEFYGNTDDESKKLVLEDYLDGLINHASSLENLKILPTYEGEWCFSEKCIPALSKFVNLRYLSMTIIANSSNVVRSGWSSQSFDLVRNLYDPSHPVCLLLHAASLLPNLSLLSVHGTELKLRPEYNRMSLEHAVHPTVQIDSHVRSYGPLDPLKYRYAVKNLDRYYTLQRSGEDGGFRYCLS